MHNNILELKAEYLVLLTFTRMFQNKSIHVQMYNMVALKFTVKIEGTTSHELTNLAKEFLSFLLQKAITITAEYLPGSLNIKQIMCRAIFRKGVNGCFVGKLFRIFAKSGDTPT